MKRWEVQIVESRDLVFEVEAETEAEAQQIAEDMDSSEAVRDNFRERSHDWTAEL